MRRGFKQFLFNRDSVKRQKNNKFKMVLAQAFVREKRERQYTLYCVKIDDN